MVTPTPREPADRSGRRRVVAVALAALAVVAGLPPARAQAPARLPLRNLLVEVRQGDESSFSATSGGLTSGAVTIGPNGDVQARAGVGVDSRRRDASADGVSQLRVLNGAQGILSVGASVPVVWFDAVLTASGPAVVGGQRLVDTGRSVAVRPRWPGGLEPVTVEVRTASSAMAGGGMPSRHAFDGQPLPDGAVDTLGLLTTLQLPLGEWVTVAGEAGSLSRRERDVVRSTDATRERRHVLQMRVTAP